MGGLAVSSLCFPLVVILVLGLVSAWAARVGRGPWWQWLLFGSMALVGGSTILALFLGPGMWLVSAGTLATMILVTTCDLSGSKRAALH